MAFAAWFARDFWFRFDHFDYLADRDVTSMNDWLRPHAGHWTLGTTTVFHLLWPLAGVDYWPWYYLTRLVGHGSVAYGVWWVLGRRGADPLLAFGTLGLVAFLSTSSYHDALTVGNYLWVGGLFLAALRVTAVENPRPRDLVVVGLGAMLALVGNGFGLSVYLALAIVVVAMVLRGEPRRWLLALVPPGTIYATWFLWYRSDPGSVYLAPLEPRTAIDVVVASFVVLRTTVHNVLGVPEPVAAVVLVGCLAALLLLAVTGRFDRFDWVVTLTLGSILLTLAMTRTVPQPSTQTNLRYGYSTAILLLVLLVPRVHLPNRRLVRAAAAAVLAVVVIVNAVVLADRLAAQGKVGRRAREYAEATAVLIADGEPRVSFASVGINVPVRRVVQLVERGWAPERPEEGLLDEVRGLMRVNTPQRLGVDDEDIFNRVELLDIPEGAPPTAAGVREGCLEVAPGAVARIEVTDEAAVTVAGRVRFTWQDRDGTFERPVIDRLVGLAMPVGPTGVTVTATGRRPATICGLAPPDP